MKKRKAIAPATKAAIEAIATNRKRPDLLSTSEATATGICATGPLSQDPPKKSPVNNGYGKGKQNFLTGTWNSLLEAMHWLAAILQFPLIKFTVRLRVNVVLMLLFLIFVAIISVSHFPQFTTIFCAVTGSQNVLPQLGISCEDLQRSSARNHANVKDLLQLHLDAETLRIPVSELLPWSSELQVLTTHVSNVAVDIRRTRIPGRELVLKTHTGYSNNVKDTGDCLVRFYTQIGVHVQAVSLNLEGLGSELRDYSHSGLVAPRTKRDVRPVLSRYLNQLKKKTVPLISSGNTCRNHLHHMGNSWASLDKTRQDIIYAVESNLTGIYARVAFWDYDIVRQKRDLETLRSVQKFESFQVENSLRTIEGLLQGLLINFEVYGNRLTGASDSIDQPDSRTCRSLAAPRAYTRSLRRVSLDV